MTGRTGLQLPTAPWIWNVYPDFSKDLLAFFKTVLQNLTQEKKQLCSQEGEKKSKEFFNIPFSPLLNDIQLQIIKCQYEPSYFLVTQIITIWRKLFIYLLYISSHSSYHRDSFILHGFPAVTPCELQPRVQLRKPKLRLFVSEAVLLPAELHWKNSLEGHVSPYTMYFYHFIAYCQMWEFKLL